MNIMRPLIEKLRPLLEERFAACFKRPLRRGRRMEIQLEFPWAAKR
jgi:hypothetical protein